MNNKDWFESTAEECHRGFTDREVTEYAQKHNVDWELAKKIIAKNMELKDKGIMDLPDEVKKIQLILESLKNERNQYVIGELLKELERVKNKDHKCQKVHIGMGFMECKICGRDMS
jgi:hypothetical protein